MDVQNPNKIDLEELSKTNPQLAEAIKSLISDFSGDNGTDAESPTMPVKAKRFSLKSLHPSIADALSVFDFDGNGNVTVDEVHRGAELLKETKKKNKIAMWALVIQFVVYAILTAVSCGLLYHFLYLLKDTVVDPSTGALMVKTNDGKANTVEVSVKSHGTTFSPDTTVLDSNTGMEKICVHAPKVHEMVKLVLEGTPTKFMAENTTTDTFHVVSIGSDGASWSNTSLNLGGVVLSPDMDCTEKLLEAISNESNMGGGHDNGRRVLTETSLYKRHNDLRRRALTGSIPTELLRNLNTGDNDFTGSIPAELGSISNWKQLAFTNVGSGSIPSEYWSLRSSELMWSANTVLTGSVPSEFGQFSELQPIYMPGSANTVLTGSVPTELGQISELQPIDMSEPGNHMDMP